MPTLKGKLAIVQISPTATKPGVIMVEVSLDDQKLTIVDDPKQNIAIKADIRKMAESLIERVIEEAQK